MPDPGLHEDASFADYRLQLCILSKIGVRKAADVEASGSGADGSLCCADRQGRCLGPVIRPDGATGNPVMRQACIYAMGQYHAVIEAMGLRHRFDFRCLPLM